MYQLVDAHVLGRIVRVLFYVEVGCSLKVAICPFFPSILAAYIWYTSACASSVRKVCQRNCAGNRPW